MNLLEQTKSLAAKKAGLERAGKLAREGWIGLTSPGYMTWVENRPERALCKRCGALLMQAGQHLPSYTEITLTFDDRSAHITQVCKNCRDRGFDLPTLDALYCADLVALAAEEEMQDCLMRWELLATRKVQGFY